MPVAVIDSLVPIARAGRNLDEALARAKAAVTADPQLTAAHFTLATILDRRRDVPEAIKEYNEVLRLNPRAASAQIQLARLSLASGDTAAAARYAQEAVLTQPANLDARFAVARTALVGRNFAAAEKEIAGLLKDAPNVARVHALNGTLEAAKNNVLPMDDRTAERIVPEMAGRPTLIRGTTQVFYEGMGRLSENSVVNIKNKSFSVTASITVPEGGASGVIIAQGGRFGAWAVHVTDGLLKFTYNVLGIHEFAVVAGEPIPPGEHQVRMEFAYDGGGLAKGGTVTLFHDGGAVGEGIPAGHLGAGWS